MPLANQRVDLPVIVDEAKCLEGCTVCIEVCPLDVLAKNPDTHKAYMKYDECWYCLPCEKECPTGAITVKLPFLLR
jgi:NAD-dependent dihydropyrimidine dehydrogenase PreA subunit